MRTLVSIGIISIIYFLWWFFSEDRMGYPWLFWPLTMVMLFKFLRTLHEWYHYFHISVPSAPPLTKKYKVDILTTACPGEPKEMIIETLEAMQAITYPHTSYLCDEGNDPELKAVCERLGVRHVTRKEKINAKAGNINNALKQADGEICIVLDPDHVPFPHMIDRLLPYFDDPKIGFVQSVQAYKNQKESLVALGACEQTYHFYGPMMMSMNSYGTAQAIGANCAFRRSALDSIGGHAPGLAEDMHTSMLLHSKGWKSVYVPEILTKGLVPASVPAYYKQQLKWSRGTFDLLFKVIPKIFSNLTFRQKLHYLSIPLYFFYGIIDFLNLLIPILSLILAEFAWQVDLIEFIRATTPVIVMTLLIRQYSQNWLLEKHERGFHMVGGLLRIGTWWVFSLGFIYTLFNIKVPYIPTPKDGEPENSFRLSLPNIIVCLLSVAAIVYGLHVDWSPYTFFMAGLAGLNVLTIGYIVIIGQQKTLIALYDNIQKTSLQKYIYPSRLLWWNFRHGLYAMLRKSSFYASCLTILFASTWLIDEEKEITYYALDESARKTPLQIFKGMNLGAINDSSLVPYKSNEKFEISYFEFKTNYSNGKILKELISKIEGISANYPMLVIKYDKDSLDTTSFNERAMTEYFHELAQAMKTTSKPFFITPITYSPIFTDEISYTEHWKKIIDEFKKEGVSNVIWVWPGDKLLKSRFPGNQYADWISTTIYKESYKSDYSIFKSKFTGKEYYGIPFLTIVKSETDNLNQTKDATIANEIRKLDGVHAIIFHKSTTANVHKQTYSIPLITTSIREPNKFANRNKLISKNKGTYQYIVDGQPYYIRAVAYNSPRFMQEGHIPLTRSQLRKDFENIKTMGSNTIRRFRPSIYDKNIITVAEEKNLKLLYGFDFPPNIDYSKDTIQTNKYLKEIEENINNFKNSQAILCWVLGSHTNADFQYYYHKPQLNEVRMAYLKFIERATLLIKKLDSSHPVIAIVSHDHELQSAIVNMHNFVPSADILGYNCNTLEELHKIDSMANTIDYGRPYIISELNLDIYQAYKAVHPGETEKTDHEKASVYFWNWLRHVEFNKGKNLGGIAYTWKDRQEGFQTLAGLADFKGRLKPSYYKLKKIWNDKDANTPMPWAYFTGPQLVKENGKYRFKCVEEFPGDYEYEWFIQTFEISNGLGKIEEVGEGNVIEFELANNINSFRLYLYVNDENGNVVTYSQTINIEEINIQD